MTADEILKNKDTFDENYPTISLYDAEEAMKEFAKYHVEQALKEAYKNSVIKTTTRQYEGVITETKKVVESSIINAYPFENIK